MSSLPSRRVLRYVNHVWAEIGSERSISALNRDRRAFDIVVATFFSRVPWSYHGIGDRVEPITSSQISFDLLLVSSSLGEESQKQHGAPLPHNGFQTSGVLILNASVPEQTLPPAWVRGNFSSIFCQKTSGRDRHLIRGGIYIRYTRKTGYIYTQFYPSLLLSVFGLIYYVWSFVIIAVAGTRYHPVAAG